MRQGGIARGLWPALLALTAGCGGDSASQPAPTEQVYFDIELNRPVVAAPGLETPAANPDTGHLALMPALYCERCKVWSAAAPLDVVQRIPDARLCSKCRGPLTPEGPLPPPIE